MSSNLAWIRQYYNVPAFHGQPVTYQGEPAVILGGRRQYLRLRVEGFRRPVVTHPTFAVRYPTLPLPAAPRGWCRHCGKERSVRKDGQVGRHRWRHSTLPFRLCPGADNTPWAVCSWTVPAPGACAPSAVALDAKTPPSHCRLRGLPVHDGQCPNT